METQTQQGIEAIRRGDKTTARQLLQAAVQQNPQDVNTWLWLSGAVTTDQERLACLQQIIKVDPENAVAAKGIVQLISRGAVTVQMAPAKTEPVQSDPVVAYGAGQAAPQSNPMPSSSVAPAEKVISQPAPRPVAKIQRPQPAVQRRASEEVIFKVKPSPIPVFIRGGFLLILLALVAMLFQKTSALVVLVVLIALFTVALIVVRLIQISFASYTLTRSQLIVQEGVLNRQKKTIPVYKIQDVSYRQPILDRIFGLGDVVVESAGERGGVYLISLHNCVELSEEILKVVQPALEVESARI
jgi:membrane protein YdbS with pleckstrin-like domain